MKKLVFLFAFILFVSVVSAQDGNRRDPSKMKAALTERIKTELNTTDELTEKVVNIMMESQEEMRKVRQDATVSEDARKATISNLTIERDQKIKAVLSPAQYEALQAYNEKMRKAREERRQNSGN